MGTKIEWVRNQDGTKGETWNPVVGCTKISPGCTHCYAERMALRLAHMALADIKAGRDPGRKRHYLDVVDLEHRCWNGKVALVEEALTIPLHWRKARAMFVCSMSDLFHENMNFADIADIMQTVLLCQKHTSIILTKRPERMLEYFKFHASFFSEQPALPDNIIGMVTAENQKAADERLPLLVDSPFAVRGVSIEPMLSEINIFHFLSRWDYRPTYEYYRAAYPDMGDQPIKTFDGVDWVIVGGESGSGARPMYPHWARSVRDQCQEAGVSFFFKQWGSYVPAASEVGEWMEAGWDPRAPKHGRILDGREWNEMPGGRG